QHERAADREHLLLAAAQRAGLLTPPLAQPREIVVDALEIRGHRRSVLARDRGEAKILLDGQADEGAAPLRNVRDPLSNDLFGGQAADRSAVEADVTLA